LTPSNVHTLEEEVSSTRGEPWQPVKVDLQSEIPCYESADEQPAGGPHREPQEARWSDSIKRRPRPVSATVRARPVRPKPQRTRPKPVHRPRSASSAKARPVVKPKPAIAENRVSKGCGTVKLHRQEYKRETYDAVPAKVQTRHADYEEPYGIFHQDTWYRRGIDGPLNNLPAAKNGFATSFGGVAPEDRAKLFKGLVHSAEHRPLLLKLINGTPRTLHEG